ncbi:LLM class flavin-dependent oxidoreductase [Cellulomonas sp. DKR-3]|uniref:LLM class flavin-dependent oxidoreductase n=1 Tax=Cellulomonas fulva TaxID=2835530 RepID=A0ABS5U1N6_9CELL|nr:LLM class flavin-dependent oxidoreductase [Cellulomonas fulva]MBT0995262.1 LLM class flavin-dependent oxidoreductase [Cellulomonas fulva]
MPDYGHPLRFGTFVTPVNAPPERPVKLAQLSEELGFDLVTFQDHPYQPSFHDTWTLLTWVAARTERIGLAGNVLNLPLRQPAVLARSAASLDLLSGGRVNLGLGAGAFWDAIEAMGGGRLTPGQGVDALSEALEVIRGIWDADARGPLRAGGEHHHVTGAKRGPAPAHDIPIWLGALKPRMLRLIGRSADGWLPSQSYLQPGDLQRGNATIDEAAQAAGRDPREVTRLLNIGPLGADEIAELALEDGVSVFIVAADDPRVLERFAGDVMPDVRERVARERSARGTAPAGRVRNAVALAQRLPGIAYDELPASLVENAVEPGDRGYARYTSSYLRGGAPGLALRPQTVDQVRDSIAFADRHRDLPLGLLSAGHGISGRSVNHGGLVVDVSALNEVTVLDEATGRVRLGPGARWIDVARGLAPHGLAITSGDYGGVGVGGLVTAGGVGWFAREHGLTIDRVRSMDVVLADGSLVRASDDENVDLFWGMRGAGANFGVVVSVEIEAAPVGQVGFAQLVLDAGDLTDLLVRWGTAIESSHRSVTGQLVLGATRPGQPRYAQAMLVVDSDDPETIIERLGPVAAVAPLLDQSVALARYDEIMGAFHQEGPQRGQGEPHSHSGMVRHLTPELAAEATALLDAGAAHFFQIRAVGGAVSDVPTDATAYAWRDAAFNIAAMGTRASGLDTWWRRLEPHLEGMYLSFESDEGADVVARAFPPAHLARLRELKRRYDPTGLFRDNFYIAPAAEDEVA